MKFNCENLQVYQISRKLIIDIYEITSKFPASEKFGLVSQMSRCVISVCLNIAEGSAKISNKDFANFIRTSLGSLIELDTSLKISIDLKFISEKEYNDLEPIIKELYFKLIALHKKLKNA